MADFMPNLVERAAARLQRLPAGIALSGTHRAVGSLFPTHLPAVRTPTFHARPVTVSPVRLATFGISLPGAGFSRTAEQFRQVKKNVLTTASRVQETTRSEASRILLVTSAKRREGKTFTAINLALAFAKEENTSVLLVDCDCYSQSLTSYLGIPADLGWIDIVSGNCPSPGDLILPTSVPNLEVLVAGRHRSGISELMSSRNMKQLLGELAHQNRKRFIIMDSLPCLASNEPAILAALAGQTLFVVAANQTSRGDIDASLRLVNACPSVSLILNRRNWS